MYIQNTKTIVTCSVDENSNQYNSPNHPPGILLKSDSMDETQARVTREREREIGSQGETVKKSEAKGGVAERMKIGW